MSMPSSSDAVATMAARAPDFSLSSASKRILRDKEPWCAATRLSPSLSVSRWETRSASRLVWTNTMVVRWPSMWAAMRSNTSVPVLVRGDGADFLIGHLDGERHLALVAHVHDSAIGSAVLLTPFRADEQARYLVNRLLRGAQADALEPIITKRVEPLQRERQMRAPLIARDRVYLVHDHGARGLQNLAAALGRQEDIERLGRGDEDVGAFFEHEPSLARRGVAGSHRHANLGKLHALFSRERADFAQRLLQILLDVVAERLQAERCRPGGRRLRVHPQARPESANRATTRRRPASCPCPWAPR